MRTLVLGLGNELAADDAVGLLVARAVRERLQGRADVVESSASGMALIEILAGYDRAVVVDAILTGRTAPGTVSEMGMVQVGRVVAPSTHQAGVPELAAVARRLGLTFPTTTRVLAVEVEDPFTIGGAMSRSVAEAVAGMVDRVVDLVEGWALPDPSASGGAACTTTTPSTSSSSA
ncbi:MAG TPA: hydrogenase maturation protease [Actinomycetota bacterium]|jgi:hydrogenase maturation protease|nr:hydrogenase maturation protease [Actinomycetota bacterium]